MRPAQVTIDLNALRHNLQQVRRAAPGCRIMAAVKANAYGHGLLRVANALSDSDGFGVACLEEAIKLREAGISTPITLLEGFFQREELTAIRSHHLDCVIHHSWQLDLLETEVAQAPIRVWLKVDSGMHRLGFPPEQVGAMWQRMLNSPAIEALGQMTHLATADEPEHPATLRQLSVFESSTADLGGERSIANSAGILAWPQSHADVVRPGIMLYGVSPFVGGRAVEFDLRPVMSFRSELIAVNRLKAGDAIGYGGTWRCPEPMRVGVVAAGYGDGYPRHARNGTPVLVNGEKVPLVGRVSMDMLTVDLRSQPEARVGDSVVLWGDGLPAEEVAEFASTIAYELFCSVTQRVPYREFGQSA